MSLILGLCAAIFWAVHDLLVRQISQTTPILPMLFLVLLSGTVFLMLPAALSAEWGALTKSNLAISTFAGVTFSFAGLCLYIAFSIGPVRLVAPIIGAYPILSLTWAMFNGTSISGLQWAAVLVVVMGIGMVTVLSAPSETIEGRVRAIVFASLAGVGFATTFAAAQAAVSGGADIPTIFVSRVSATATIGIFLIVRAQAPLLPSTLLPRLGLMGLLDASALGLVTISGSLPNPQLAAVSASLFGMLTIVLARIILREPMNGLQWFAATLVFGGIGVLGFF